MVVGQGVVFCEFVFIAGDKLLTLIKDVVHCVPHRQAWDKSSAVIAGWNLWKGKGCSGSSGRKTIAGLK